MRLFAQYIFWLLTLLLLVNFVLSLIHRDEEAPLWVLAMALLYWGGWITATSWVAILLRRGRGYLAGFLVLGALASCVGLGMAIALGVGAEGLDQLPPSLILSFASIAVAVVIGFAVCLIGLCQGIWES